MKLVVISGPESSGKTTLTMQLAEYYSVKGVSEYARDYVERLNRPYTLIDVETIAFRQIATYKSLKRSSDDFDIVFFDTFLVITKVWFQEVYKFCPIWLHQAILAYKPDLVLLCKPDLEWIFDGTRENPDRREYLYDCYYNEFKYYGINIKLVEGFGLKRFENSVNILKAFGLKKM